MFAVGDWGRVAATTTEAVRVNAESFGGVWQIMFPEDFATYCIDAVNDDVAALPFLRSNGQ